MTPAQKAATALLGAPVGHDQNCSWHTKIPGGQRPYGCNCGYMDYWLDEPKPESIPTIDDEKHDRDRLRQWLLACIGRRPTDLRTAIGEEALQLILKPITADLEILSLQEAEKHLTRF